MEGLGEMPGEIGEQKYLHWSFAGLEIFLTRLQGWVYTLAQLLRLMGSKTKVMYRAADGHFIGGRELSNPWSSPNWGLWILFRLWGKNVAFSLALGDGDLWLRDIC